MTNQDIPFIAPRPGLPRRVFVGALLAAIGAAAMVGPGYINAHTSASENFAFSRGTALAKGEADRMRAWILENTTQPRTQLRIIGHSGTEGNEDANRQLSQHRAEIALDIARDMGLDNTMFAIVEGVGGGGALPKVDGESDREYQRRLARVTLQTVYSQD